MQFVFSSHYYYRRRYPSLIVPHFRFPLKTIPLLISSTESLYTFVLPSLRVRVHVCIYQSPSILLLPPRRRTGRLSSPRPRSSPFSSSHHPRCCRRRRRLLTAHRRKKPVSLCVTTVNRRTDGPTDGAKSRTTRHRKRGLVSSAVG